jgi:hypothetical protein
MTKEKPPTTPDEAAKQGVEFSVHEGFITPEDAGRMLHNWLDKEKSNGNLQDTDRDT